MRKIRGSLAAVVFLFLVCGCQDNKEDAGSANGALGDDTDSCIDQATEAGASGMAWVTICGGTFQMGSTSVVSDGTLTAEDATPVHPVTVPTFEMLQTEVTVTQYRACVDAGACTVPDTSHHCSPTELGNWGAAGREENPVSCVSWDQAVAFCDWAGGRLPSEAEWEYAARSEGQNIAYPWGDDPATCDYAVMAGGGSGCGKGERSWPVCSKTAGNTDQKLCDMAGNVFEWVRDLAHQNYTGAPDDGSAWEVPATDQYCSSCRVIRGGSFDDMAEQMNASERGQNNPSTQIHFTGMRCAR
jgi:formylglycine-generating enzyme